MIIKSYEFSKINLNSDKFFLLYGENEGLKDEMIEKIKEKFSKNIFRYDEKEILENKENFLNGILSKSLFEKEKLVIINRTTDKARVLIEEIIEKNISDTIIIFVGSLLDKKSKIRNFFEKNKKTICIAFYPDTHQALNMIAINYFKEKKISISQEIINLIIDRSRGSRLNLNNELNKIENYCKDRSKVSLEDIIKLTNLAENYHVSELTDICLSKNTKKTARILNENILALEDTVLITRTFLSKIKRLLKIRQEIENKINIDIALKNFRPPIFWKDKEIVKLQVTKWSPQELKKLIVEINDIEILVKKYSSNSINILSDFILTKSTSISN
tara:strand:+ start:798 stop:1790 length:993 start_codon:yes stop_codon:yes gene_type:complete